MLYQTSTTTMAETFRSGSAQRCYYWQKIDGIWKRAEPHKYCDHTLVQRFMRETMPSERFNNWQEYYTKGVK
jgi:hypothetical protein